jgi:serine/threonine-protein kinase
MSPEQARAESIDGRADLYSLGCVYYELLTGHAPFDAEATIDVMSKQVHSPRPALPDRLVADKRPPSAASRAIYDALLSKRREDRPAGAVTVARIFAAISLGSAIDVARALAEERTERTEVGEGELTAATMIGARRGGEAERLKIMNAATAVPSPEVEITDEVRTAETAPAIPSFEEQATPIVPQVAIAAARAGGAVRAAAAVVGVAAIAFFAVVLVVWARGSAVVEAPLAADVPAPPPAPVTPPAPVVEPAAEPTIEPAVEPVAATDAGVAPARSGPAHSKKTVVKAERQVTIETTPPGAEVLRAGAVIGRTPFTLRLGERESAELVLRKEKFLDRKVTVGADSSRALRFDLIPVW